MEKRLNELIKLLFDERASIAERDDAAMDLFEYNDDLAENALIKIAKNKKENPIILNSCGESIGTIWVKKNKFDKDCYNNLSKESQDGIHYIIKTDKPEWLNYIQ